MTRPAVVQDDYVIAALVHGLVDTSLLHRPALEREWTSGFGRVQAESLDDRMERMSIPSSWPSACGLVERGSIYNYAGPLAGLPICPDCVAVLAGTKRPVKLAGAIVRGRHLTAAEREALALIAEHGEVTSGLMAQARGMTRKSANNQLTRLLERGAIVRVGFGRYSLAPESDAA